MTMLAQLFFVLFTVFQGTFAVKDNVFKSCEQSGFCHRNRVFAGSIGAGTFESQYSIDSKSITIDESIPGFSVKGTVLKNLPRLNDSKIELPFELSILEGNNLRFKLNEKRETKIKNVNSKRYDEVEKWAFHKSPLPFEEKSTVFFEKQEDRIKISYGANHKYRIELSFFPLKLSLYVNNKLEMVANDKQFLNFEHFREKESSEKHLSDQESDYNMFEDNFPDSKRDRLPLGPESIGLDFTFKGIKNLFGIPEHADSLLLKDTLRSDPYRLFNVDIFEYEVDSRFPMYGSIPFLTAFKPGVSIGIFWVNAADTFVDIDLNSSKKDSNVHWMSETGVLDFIVSIGREPADINFKYGLVTGFPQLPQLFSLGYHQCRWNYNDESDVLEINNLFDKHQIPYDTIWLDVEYTDSRKYFTWNPDNFPNPEKMLKELDHTGRNMVIIIDPHLKINYEISDFVVKNQIGMNDHNNRTFQGHCWPGESVWIDTLNPSTQKYWDELHGLKEGSCLGESENIYLWNDMSEPSVFDGPETSAPKDNLHYGQWEHRSIHNLNGLTFHETTYKSMIKRLTSKERQRPFILTRSYFAGSQRTAAMWTGDNMSRWEYLKISIPMVLTSNVVNMPFAGADVGGFFGDPSKELLTRWYQTGIWYPFFRAHAHIDTRRREPWIPGDPYTSLIRDAIRLRYSLLPVFYTEFHNANIKGTPIIKPIFYENPENIDAYSVDDEFFLGNSGILIRPVTEKNAKTVSIYLPDKEIYYSYTSGAISSKTYQLSKPGNIVENVSLSDVPMLVKGGSIFARKNRYRRSTKLMEEDPYTLTVVLDKKNTASGSLYIDDGVSFKNMEGEFIEVEFEAKNGELYSKVSTPVPNFANNLRDVKIEQIVIASENPIHAAKIEQGGQVITQKVVKTDKIYTIKRPQLFVASEWKIKFEKDSNTYDEL